MGRRTNIGFAGLSMVVWGLNGVMNYWTYHLAATPSLMRVSLFNVVLMSTLSLVSLGQLWKLLAAPRQDRILDPQATIVVEESRVVRGFRSLALAIVLGAGVWGLVTDDPILASVDGRPGVSLLLIGLGTYGLLRLLLNPRQRLVLTPQSLSYSQVRPAVIAWDDLAEVRAKTFLTRTTLTLQLRDRREFRPASLLARWRRVEKVSFNPLTFGVDPKVLEKGIELRRNVFTF